MTEPKQHDGETTAEALDRVSDDFEDLFDRHRASRARVGLLDLPHALVNLPVEWCRADPWMTGHIWFFQTLATVVIGISLAVWVML